LTDIPRPLLDFAERTASYHAHPPLLELVTTAQRVRTRRTPEGSDVLGVFASALSRGDLQLLTLLPTRASNAAIAEHLGVSVNTVKTRLRRLYTKLDVHDRDSAIARATDAGLLPTQKHGLT